jgi:hypothetical protein
VIEGRRLPTASSRGASSPPIRTSSSCRRSASSSLASTTSRTKSRGGPSARLRSWPGTRSATATERAVASAEREHFAPAAVRRALRGRPWTPSSSRWTSVTKGRTLGLPRGPAFYSVVRRWQRFGGEGGMHFAPAAVRRALRGRPWTPSSSRWTSVTKGRTLGLPRGPAFYSVVRRWQRFGGEGGMHFAPAAVRRALRGRPWTPSSSRWTSSTPGSNPRSTSGSFAF